jgi:hypothetical protein
MLRGRGLRTSNKALLRASSGVYFWERRFRRLEGAAAGPDGADDILKVPDAPGEPLGHCDAGILRFWAVGSAFGGEWDGDDIKLHPGFDVRQLMALYHHLCAYPPIFRF